MRSVYFALKFFYENVLNEKFDEKLPLTKSKQKLPVVLNRKKRSPKAFRSYSQHKTQGCPWFTLLRWFAFERGKKFEWQRI